MKARMGSSHLNQTFADNTGYLLMKCGVEEKTPRFLAWYCMLDCMFNGLVSNDCLPDMLLYIYPTLGLQQLQGKQYKHTVIKLNSGPLEISILRSGLGTYVQCCINL